MQNELMVLIQSTESELDKNLDNGNWVEAADLSPSAMIGVYWNYRGLRRITVVRSIQGPKDFIPSHQMFSVQGADFGKKITRIQMKTMVENLIPSMLDEVKDKLMFLNQ